MLKALLLRKRINEKNKALKTLREKDFTAREAELAQAIDEITEETDAETREALQESIDAFDAEKDAHGVAVSELEEEIRQLEEELAQEEAAQKTDPVPVEEPHEERSEFTMAKRAFRNMDAQAQRTFIEREDVKKFLAETRACIAEKRALSNVGVVIPEVFLGLLKANIADYSKVLRHISVKPLNGTGRIAIMGTVGEAIWTDCCANLNELDLAFNDWEFDCWRVGGYYAVCNANLEDSDIDLAGEIIEALGQAIGLAVDKAVLYGTGTRMPLGCITRIAQTAEPTGYPQTARPWADLHTTNIKTIAGTYTGKDLFAQIVIASGAAKGKYSRGEKVWFMNETTYTKIVAEAMAVDAGGAIVASVNGVMPVAGGVIEVLEFIPDNNIIVGYFDLYTLAERAGNKFAQSEHVRFLADQTIFKGTARYDGAPIIAEAFVVMGIGGTTPTTTVNFAPDTADDGE